MAESSFGIDKHCVFRETFESVDSVKRRGGIIISGISITNSKLYISDHTSYLDYRSIIPIGLTSIRFTYKQVSAPPVAPYYILMSPFYIRIDLDTSISTSLGANAIIYVNGIQTNFINVLIDNEIIVTTLIAITGLLRIGSYGYGAGLGEYKYFEVYSRTLTYEEVRNLYGNKRHKDLVPSHPEQLWTVAYAQNVNGYYSFGPVLTAGSLYKITVNTNRTERIDMFTFTPSLDNTTVPAGITTYIRRGADAVCYLFPYSVGNVNSFKVEKYVVEPTKEILNVSALNGVVMNKYSDNITGNNLASNCGFSDTTDWVDSNSDGLADTLGIYLINSFSILTEGGKRIQRIIGTGNWHGFQKGLVLVTGSKYKVTIKYRGTGGGLYMDLGSLRYSIPASTANWQEYSFTGLSDNTSFLILVYIGLADYIDIEYINIKLVIPSVVNTAVSVVKENDVYAMKFNGSTSKINCGSYDALIGDKTIIYWSNHQKYRTVSDGHIVNNGNLIIDEVTYLTGDSELFISSNSGITFPTFGLLKKNKANFIVITRTAAGLGTAYVNGSLQGTPNQNTGTPAVGTSIWIGNRSDGVRGYKGLIPSVRILDGILTAQEITQLYSSEKKLYGL